MSTNGRVVLRYKGVYFIFYNHWDSYFEGKGDDLVKEIRQVTDLNLWRRLLELVRCEGEDKFQAPAENTDARREWDEILSKLPEEMMVSDYFRATDKSCLDYEGQHSMLKLGDVGIEYTYVICLDDEVFHVSDYYSGYVIHWPISEIPENWIHLARKRSGNITSNWIHKSFVAEWTQKLSKAGYQTVEWLEHSPDATVWNVVETKSRESKIIKVFYEDHDKEKSREPAIAQQLIESPKKLHLVQFEKVVDIDQYRAIVMEKYEGDCRENIDILFEPSDALLEHTDGHHPHLLLLTMSEHIAVAIQELQNLGIVHHDVKLKNILYKKGDNGEYMFALCDFEGAGRSPSLIKNKDDEKIERSDNPFEQRPTNLRWEEGWEPIKYTKQFLPYNAETMSPSRIDFGTLANNLKIFLDCKETEEVAEEGKYQDGASVTVEEDTPINSTTAAAESLPKEGEFFAQHLSKIISALEDHSKESDATVQEVQKLVQLAKEYYNKKNTTSMKRRKMEDNDEKREK